MDQALARLAVEARMISPQEAAHFWQQAQAPGAPRFVQLLVQQGRLQRADVDRLKSLWQQQQGGAAPAGQTGAFGPPPGQTGGFGPAAGQPGGFGPPPGQPGGFAPAPGQSGGFSRPAGGPPSGAHARPATGNLGGAPGGAAGADALANDGAASWEEALQRDAQLARLLHMRSLVTQDRLRECRELQVKHRVRLGVILVKKGYVERGAVEEALAAVRAQAPGAAGVGSSGRAGRPEPAPAPAPADPFAPPPGGVDQDAMPTLNVGPGGLAALGAPPVVSTPGGGPGPQDAIPTIMSVDELNPFAAASTPARKGGGGPPPGHLSPMLSGDELNAFENVPLAPVGSVRGQLSPLAGSTRGAQPPADFGAGPAPAPAGFDAPAAPGWGAEPAPMTPAGPPGMETPDTTRGPAAGEEHVVAGGKETKKKKTKQPEPAKGSNLKLVLILLGAFVVFGVLILGVLWVFVLRGG